MSTKAIIDIIERATATESVAIDDFIKEKGMTKGYYSNFRNGHSELNLDSVTKYIIALKRAVKNKNTLDEAVENIVEIFFSGVAETSLQELYKSKYKSVIYDKAEDHSYAEHSSIISMLRAEGVGSKEIQKIKEIAVKILDDVKGYL
ncbi:MAG: hypothetical protein C0602_05960 [Denitrovibrio sp.]|nr:MAG: hypothetical protein C0602_05960 [Denitrovibrio sp.]